MNIPIKILPHGQDMPLPSYATDGSAGLDLLACIRSDVTIKPSKHVMIPTGICLALPDGFEAQVRSRSGMAGKSGVIVLNSPGTIDSDYRGEICVILINLGQEDFIIKRGMRIAQMIVSRFERVELCVTKDLDKTSRDDGGFGSTGA